MKELVVKITEQNKSYPIYITNSDINSLKDSITDFLGEKDYVVVISKKVNKLYSKLLGFPKEKVLVLNDGESEKNIKNYAKILDFVQDRNLTRKDAIIAIGGGVIGDLAGFAASTYMRGVDFIQVPTTLLACTDSSVGGKTAINTSSGKNLVGSFYQPKAVFINTNFLKTLDNKQFQSGMGEVLKYAFIEKSCGALEDFNLINFLTENIEKIKERDTLILQELIAICVGLKISVVQKDEKESGLRRILNYGHTYAHAIETLTKYRRYTHGECVVEGIIQALNMALKLNLTGKEYYFLCMDLIKKYGYEPMNAFGKKSIIRIMKSDKKSYSDGVSYVLPNDYAQVCIKDMSFDELEQVL